MGAKLGAQWMAYEQEYSSQESGFVELLLQEVQRSERSLRVVFWRIPREWNQVADRGAKEAAAERDGPKEYCKIHGFLV
jgi:hypothetical protein